MTIPADGGRLVKGGVGKGAAVTGGKRGLFTTRQRKVRTTSDETMWVSTLPYVKLWVSYPWAWTIQPGPVDRRPASV